MILNVSPLVENPSWQRSSSNDNTIIIPSYYHYNTIIIPLYYHKLWYFNGIYIVSLWCLYGMYFLPTAEFQINHINVFPFSRTQIDTCVICEICGQLRYIFPVIVINFRYKNVFFFIVIWRI